MICALGAALCFGTATVLQAAAARTAAPGTGGGSGVDVRLLWRALRQWRYLLGLALDGLGFLLEVAALRVLPLYAVGAALAASLAVTAALSTRLLGTRLRSAERAAVAGVCGGLALLALAAGPEGRSPGPAPLPWTLLAAAAALLLLGAAAGRLPARPRALLLGLGAGLGFGVVEVAVRLLDGVRPADPALWALLLGGATAFLLLTSAFQRGAVTTATAGMVLGETLAPAGIGLAWLGDRTRPGLGPLALAGFALAVASALALARFGEPPEEPEASS
ncbi:hypothetical protein ACIQRS_29185 [Streptomyces termitum]|nr:hypothetical protein [Streptomyces termitum]